MAPSCRDILIFPFGKTKEIGKNFPHVERSRERPVFVGRSSAFPEGSEQRASSYSYHPPPTKNGRSHKIDWRCRCGGAKGEIHSGGAVGTCSKDELLIEPSGGD